MGEQEIDTWEKDISLPLEETREECLSWTGMCVNGAIWLSDRQPYSQRRLSSQFYVFF